MTMAENKENTIQRLDGPEHISANEVFMPRVDIRESQDHITVIADMPGVDQNSVDINLEKNLLMITGLVKTPEYQQHSLLYKEYQAGDYRRAFTLSNEIDRNGIEAVVKNGVLKLTLLKSQESLSKKIVVKEG